MNQLIRTASHVHSTWSYDGKWPLEKLSRSFSQLGYRAVLMTEHDQGFSEFQAAGASGGLSKGE